MRAFSRIDLSDKDTDMYVYKLTLKYQLRRRENGNVGPGRVVSNMQGRLIDMSLSCQCADWPSLTAVNERFRVLATILVLPGLVPCCSQLQE